MQIREMFEKRIDRDIKGVIKVGQSDEENVYQELDEYVVTKELLKHFGSVKKLKEATLEQLEEVLPKEVAKNLFTVLQNTK